MTWRNAVQSLPFTSQHKLLKTVSSKGAHRDTANMVTEMYKKYPSNKFKNLGELYTHLGKETTETRIIGAKELHFNPDGTITLRGETMPAYQTFLADLARRLGSPENNFKIFGREKLVNVLNYLLDDQKTTLGIQIRNGHLFSVSTNKEPDMANMPFDNGLRLIRNVIQQLTQSEDDHIVDGQIGFDELGIKLSTLNRTHDFVPEALKTTSSKAVENYYHGLLVHISTRGQNLGHVRSTIQRNSCSNSAILPLSDYNHVRGTSLSDIISGATLQMKTAIAKQGQIGLQLGILANMVMTPQAMLEIRDNCKLPEVEKIKIMGAMNDIILGNGSAYDAFNVMTHHGTHNMKKNEIGADKFKSFAGMLLSPTSAVRKVLAENAHNQAVMQRLAA